MNQNFDLLDTNIGVLLCTSSTRPSGGALFSGIQIYEADTGLAYAYDGATWQRINIPVLLCTAATRPTGNARYTGQLIQETDTDKLLMWNGSGWQYMGGSDFITATTGIVSGAGSNTIANQDGIKRMNSKLIAWTVEITVASAITATSGNVVDTLIGTIQSGWRPPITWQLCFAANMIGGGYVDSGGGIWVRSASDTIGAGVTLRTSAFFPFNN